MARRIEVDVASHHPIIDPVLPELRAALAGFDAAARPSRSFPPPRITTAPLLDAEYWAANLRNRCGSARPSPPRAPSMPPSSRSAASAADPRHQRHPGRGSSPQHRNAAARHPRHADFPHQPQRHPHPPPPTPHPPEPPPVLPTTPGTTPTIGSPAPAVPVAAHLALDRRHGPNERHPGVESTLGPDFLWLGDHCVDDACVLPGRRTPNSRWRP